MELCCDNFKTPTHLSGGIGTLTACHFWFLFIFFLCDRDLIIQRVIEIIEGCNYL